MLILSIESLIWWKVAWFTNHNHIQGVELASSINLTLSGFKTKVHYFSRYIVLKFKEKWRFLLNVLTQLCCNWRSYLWYGKASLAYYFYFYLTKKNTYSPMTIVQFFSFSLDWKNKNGAFIFIKFFRLLAQFVKKKLIIAYPWTTLKTCRKFSLWIFYKYSYTYYS